MGDITTSGGGFTAVGTDEMLEHARALGALAPQIEGWAATLFSPAARPVGTRPAPQWRHDDPETHVLAAHSLLRTAGEDARRLASELDTAAEGYGRTERLVAALSDRGGAFLGWAIGFASPAVLVAASFAALGLGVGVLLSLPITHSPQVSIANLGRAIRRSGLLSSPVFVRLLRTSVSSVDDVMLGAAHVPWPFALALDDGMTGLFGLRGATRTIVALAGPRLLKETPVAVGRTGAGAAGDAWAATRFSELAERIPPGGVGKPQVRIEKYPGENGRPRWIVYAGGTVDTALAATSEPWDDTSNVHGVAQLDPGSVRATLQAMKEAGVQAGDAVLSVGYSQGGIVATAVVREGGFANAGLVTFGSPTAGVEVPAGVPNVAVEIAEDAVPALGGDPRDAQHGGLERVQVSRSIYDAAHPPPADELLPAHALENYRETAALMDASGHPGLAGMRDVLAEFTGGAEPEVSLWRADRVGVSGSAEADAPARAISASAGARAAR